ncbi:hypothetical protein SBA3_690030 [Candidatus Sulfopaludibacter sp. SbA3]|nr:hypothetical protein SBA3_690030 [Candidatus Sulfopaludibacter sp. SbA3]
MWDAACQSAAWNRYQAETYNCTYGCFDPCQPDFCQAVADADYNSSTDYCDNTVWDAWTAATATMRTV